LKREVDLDEMMRSLRAAATQPAKVPSMQPPTSSACSLLLSAIRRERHDDPDNPVYKGFHYMLQVVEQLCVKPALLSRISYEMVGGLRGMSPKSIQAWWSEAEVSKLLDEIVKEETSAQKIAQRFAPRTLGS
jgi:hypothetical protein